MNEAHLVDMANDIGNFFAAGREPAAAAAEVAAHLRRLWDPRMRRQIIAYWSKGGGGFSDVARAAVALLAAGQTPAG